MTLWRRTSFVVTLAIAISLTGWAPQARGRLVPETVSREVPVSLRTLVNGRNDESLSVSPQGVLRSRSSVASSPATVCAPIQFTAVGLAWNQAAGGDVHAAIKSGKSQEDLGRATEVESDGGEGPDVSSPEYHPTRRSTAMLWTGQAHCIELSLELPAGAAISGLRAVFINTSGTAQGEAPAPSTKTAGPLDGLFGVSTANAMTRRPGLVTRAEWGADESLKNCDAGYAPALKMAFVHHTAGSNDYSPDQSDDIVRSIYWYHTQVKGWCDIAYNFLVDRYGTVFVGRDGGVRQPTIPAATQGFNTGSTAVAAMGNFMDVPPTSATVTAIQRVLAWRLDVAHLPATGWAKMTSAGGPNNRYPEGEEVTLRVISGHRRTGYTDCPGDYLYGLLPEIRRATSALGTPKILRPAQSQSSITPGIDQVLFTARAGEALGWDVDITNSLGTVVRHFDASGTRLSTTWDGTDELGAPVMPGDYRVIITGANSAGATARRAVLKLTVVAPASP